MNLYLISQDENNDYDTFDSAVVAAKSTKEAQNMYPRTGKPMTEDEWKNPYLGWVKSPEQVKVTYLGVAGKKVKRGVICASFNAG